MCHRRRIGVSMLTMQARTYSDDNKNNNTFDTMTQVEAIHYESPKHNEIVLVALRVGPLMFEKKKKTTCLWAEWNR